MPAVARGIRSEQHFAGRILQSRGTALNQLQPSIHQKRGHIVTSATLLPVPIRSGFQSR